MTKQVADTRPLVCAVATSTYPGEASSGDRHLIGPRPSGILIAVVDGLGHGPEAAHAADVATATLAAAPQLPIDVLFGRCHAALETTRGAALTIATVTHTGQLEWAGIGNVEAVVVRADPDQPREHVLLRGGIVGFAQLPSLHVTTTQLEPEDVILVATDGIRAGFTEALDLAKSPDAIAQELHAEFARGTDDALVLVAQFQGSSP